MKLSPEIERCIEKVHEEFKKSPHKDRYDLKVIPKMPDQVRIILYGKFLRKEKDIYPNQISHIRRVMNPV